MTQHVPTMEEIGTSNPEYYHCEFSGTCSCAHARKTIPLAPIHPFTKQIVTTFILSIIIYPKPMQIIFTVFLYEPYKGLPSMNNFFMRFIFSSLFHFHCTLFHGLAGVCMNPRSFSLFVHSLVCPNNSLTS